jgi:hypothetical protein
MFRALLLTTCVAAAAAAQAQPAPQPQPIEDVTQAAGPARAPARPGACP